MKHMRGKNLQLAGVELVLPTVLCIDGCPGKGGTLLGYASGYADTIVAPLAAAWLSRIFHRSFVEHGRGADGDLAAEAFYDKIASEFSREEPFLAAIVSPQHATASDFGADGANSALAKLHQLSHGRANRDVLSRFMTGAGLVRWTFEGPVRAFLNARTGAAQIAFDPLPGGIDLTATDKLESPSARSGKRAHAAEAWYGFGVPVRDPADIVMMLRNETTDSRHAQPHPRRAAHV